MENGSVVGLRFDWEKTFAKFWSFPKAGLFTMKTTTEGLFWGTAEPIQAIRLPANLPATSRRLLGIAEMPRPNLEGCAMALAQPFS